MALAALDPATRYALDVIEGRIVVGELVRLQCERHLRDLETAHERGFYFDPAAPARFFEWAFRFCRHWKGDQAGERVMFEPWQMFALGLVFGWKRIADGKRRFRVVWHELAKKNGKSTMAGVVLLYLLMADREAGPEVYAFATRRDQAKIVFNSARRMAIKSPALHRRLHVGQTRMEYPPNDGECAPIGADADSIEGKNPHAAVGDEIHLHKSAEAWENMGTAQASRSQPLLFGITTAGDASDPTTLYNRQRNYAENVLRGVFDDDEHLPFIAAFDDDDDFLDESIWVKANPNIDISVRRDFLRQQFRMAEREPAEQNSILRKHGNVRTQQANRVISVPQFQSLGDREWTWEALAGRKCFVGVDLSSKLDLSATGYVFPPAGPDPLWRLKWDCFIPAETDRDLVAKSRKAGGQYGLWKKSGDLIVHDGPRIKQSLIRQQLKLRAETLQVEKVGFDPWQAAELGNQLMDEDGFNVVEVPQTFKYVTAPTREIIELVAVGDVGHDGNPVAEWAAGNLAVKRGPNDVQAPDKAKSAGKIDPLVASIIGLALALAERAGGALQIDDDYTVGVA